MRYKTAAKLRERAAIRDRSRRQRRRRRLRMSVRELLVLIAACAGAMGWAAHRARVERTAAEAIFRSGGSCSFDWQYAEGVHDSSAQPGRLTTVLGSGHFEHVASILGGPRFNNNVYAG